MANSNRSREFLHRVATDPAFRSQVENDPASAFKQYGIELREGAVPPEGIKLPSNESILKNLDHLSGRMEDTVGEIFFCL